MLNSLLQIRSCFEMTRLEISLQCTVLDMNRYSIRNERKQKPCCHFKSVEFSIENLAKIVLL